MKLSETNQPRSLVDWRAEERTMVPLLRPCPWCASRSAYWLEGTSTESLVNYCRCDECGCVWTIPKDQPDATPTLVAQGVGQPPDARLT